MMRLPHPDWLYHHLSVRGADDAVAAFRDAASGAGTVPWRLDLEQLEEDAFHTLASAGSLSLHGAQILAGQLREAAARRHGLAVARLGHSRACPFDLHALVPVPDAVLALGPDHPDALAWLWAAWGTTDALRRVGMLPGTTASVLRIGFWSADWTPWRALARIRADWPGLCLSVRPHYDQG